MARSASNRRPGRAEILAALERTMRGPAIQGLLFSRAVADLLGLSPSEVEALACLGDDGPMTAGQLSEVTGLTTGAVTRLIDRLEQAGYVRRSSDPHDRRRVIVELAPERSGAVARLFESLRRALAERLARYGDDELALILAFNTETEAVMRAEVAKLRRESAAAPGSAADAAEAAHTDEAADFAIPLRKSERGVLTFPSGAFNVRLRGSQALPELCRGHFEGPPPRVTARDGGVRLTYRRLRFDLRERTAQVTLNATVPWQIELRGGLSRLTADLRALPLLGIELQGGASRVDLTLPQPSGTVNVRLAGGLTHATLHRPAGTAIRVRALDSGIQTSRVDGKRVNLSSTPTVTGANGEWHWASPGYARARNRYEIVVEGGASALTIDAS